MKEILAVARYLEWLELQPESVIDEEKKNGLKWMLLNKLCAECEREISKIK